MTADPSDDPVQLQGSAFILVALHSVASAQVGAPAAPQERQTPLFDELREIAGAGDFEGVVSFGLGLSAQTGFRISTFTNPDRLVVDVQALAIPATRTGSRGVANVAAVLLLAGAAAVFLTRRPRFFH